MLSSLAIAYLAGLVTVLNPCVLPVLPIVLATALSENRYGPLALGFGLVVAFSTFGLLITAFGFSLGLSEALVRQLAAILLVLAGLVLMSSFLQQRLIAVVSPLTAGANRVLGRVSGSGLLGQFALGALLGLVWSPCVGPTLGVAIAAASQGRQLGPAFLTFLVFGLGVVTVLMLIAYGSRQALAVRGQRARVLGRYAKPALGAIVLTIGISIISGVDKQLEAWLLEHMPASLVALTTKF